MSSTANLAGRAALAILLMVAFYGLALASVAALIAAPVLLARLSLGLALKIALFCLVGVFLILKSIVPRRDHFEPPGPMLTAEDHPQLFAEIRRLAARLRQAEPEEVYLIPDVNAWVSHRGGFMGLGSRRIMGVGLGLLQVVRVPELRGVLAHEFGHFHGGDVAIGPWIYKTRAALVRTVMELQEHSEGLTLPFVWYGNLFFRVTHAISRHQELLADRLAASVSGTSSLASGLQITNSAGLAFGGYWGAEVAGVLSAGFRPPLVAGFEAFLASPLVQAGVAKALEEQAATPPHPFETHPPLGERLSALEVDPARLEREPGPAAISLLADVPALEAQLVDRARASSGEAEVVSRGAPELDLQPPPRVLTPIRWEEVGTRIWLPAWRRRAPKLGAFLAGITPASLPALDWHRLGRKCSTYLDEAPPLQAADWAVGVGLALLLSRVGFELEMLPGSAPGLVGQGEKIAIFGLRENLNADPSFPEAWLALCSRIGITDLDLGTIRDRAGQAEGTVR